MGAMPRSSEPARDQGYSLVEMLVALAMLGIFAAMAATSVVAMNGSSVSSARLGNAAQSAQASMDTLVRYLQGAVAPVDLSQGQLQLPNGCGTIQSAFVALSPAPASGIAVRFCSYGVSNTSGSPALYTLDLCAGGSPFLTLSGPRGTVPLSQARVDCYTTPSEAAHVAPVPLSYVAFCATAPALPAAAVPPAGCTTEPPAGGTGDPYVYVSLSVSANRVRGASGPGSAPATTIAEAVNLPNLSGEL